MLFRPAAGRAARRLGGHAAHELAADGRDRADRRTRRRRSSPLGAGRRRRHARARRAHPARTVRATHRRARHVPRAAATTPGDRLVAMAGERAAPRGLHRAERGVHRRRRAASAASRPGSYARSRPASKRAARRRSCTCSPRTTPRSACTRRSGSRPGPRSRRSSSKRRADLVDDRSRQPPSASTVERRQRAVARVARRELRVEHRRGRSSATNGRWSSPARRGASRAARTSGEARRYTTSCAAERGRDAGLQRRRAAAAAITAGVGLGERVDQRLRLVRGAARRHPRRRRSHAPCGRFAPRAASSLSTNGRPQPGGEQPARPSSCPTPSARSSTTWRVAVIAEPSHAPTVQSPVADARVQARVSAEGAPLR